MRITVHVKLLVRLYVKDVSGAADKDLMAMLQRKPNGGNQE